MDKSPLLKSLQIWTAVTANGAVTNPTSLDPVLDLFFIAWASRGMEDKEIESLISKAYTTDPILTFKLFLWARDVRWGAGERRFFRIARDYLAKYSTLPVLKYLYQLTPTYGRWDDIWKDTTDDYTLEYVALLLKTLDFNDLNNKLLCKWLPRKGEFAKGIAKKLNWTHKQYRQFIVGHTKVVEQLMSAKKWDDIELSTLPSKAFNKYKKAFQRHLENKYEKFIEDVLKGKEKLNSKTMFPHEILAPLDTAYIINDPSKSEIETIKAQWRSYPKYQGEGKILPVVDVSGSMESRLSKSVITFKHIAISMGLYLAENIKWPFKDHFISFSGHPHLHSLSGDIVNRYKQVQDSWEDCDTNLIKVFKTLLKVAIRDNISQKDMPDTLVIFSDMEFNYCWGRSNFDTIKDLYKDAGYTMPKLVFWNLCGRLNNYPVQGDTYNTMLLSGYSPVLIKTVLKGSFDPTTAMLETLNQERYSIDEKVFTL